MNMEKFYETFGAHVFNDKEMKKRLTDETYQLLRKTIKNGKELDPSIAKDVANAMKEWAMEMGATHYSHWFQPLTGETAEKHDGFIESQKGGRVVAEFSGKNLIKVHRVPERRTRRCRILRQKPHQRRTRCLFLPKWRT